LPERRTDRRRAADGQASVCWRVIAPTLCLRWLINLAPREIKIDTFNFTRYGLLHGAVSSVSQDAVVREKPPEKGAAKSGALADTSEPQGQEFVYAARIALDSREMRIEDRMVPLSPGMAVTVEIKTGRRRVIEYLMSPLLRYKQESLRER
jgi:hemolysin D